MYYTASGIITLCRWPSGAQVERGLPCFIVSLLHASTCFEHYVFIIRRSKLYYTVSKLLTENNVSQMTSFLPDTHSEPLLKVLHRTLQHFLRQSCDFLTNGKFQLFVRDPVVLNASTHRSIVFRSGIAPRRSTLIFRRKRCWTVTTESLFLLKKLLDGKHTMLYVPMRHGY